MNIRFWYRDNVIHHQDLIKRLQTCRKGNDNTLLGLSAISPARNERLQEDEQDLITTDESSARLNMTADSEEEQHVGTPSLRLLLPVMKPSSRLATPKSVTARGHTPRPPPSPVRLRSPNTRDGRAYGDTDRR